MGEIDLVELELGKLVAHGRVRPRQEARADAIGDLAEPEIEACRLDLVGFDLGRARDLADRLAPRVAAALLVAIQTEGWERFGVCDALPCRCVYLDRSRNRSRRYCCQLCADRIAAAAYRERSKGRSA